MRLVSEPIDQPDLQLKLFLEGWLCRRDRRGVGPDEPLAHACTQRAVFAETEVYAGSGREAELRVGGAAGLCDAACAHSSSSRPPGGPDEELPVKRDRP